MAQSVSNRCHTPGSPAITPPRGRRSTGRGADGIGGRVGGQLVAQGVPLDVQAPAAIHPFRGRARVRPGFGVVQSSLSKLAPGQDGGAGGIPAGGNEEPPGGYSSLDIPRSVRRIGYSIHIVIMVIPSHTVKPRRKSRETVRRIRAVCSLIEFSRLSARGCCGWRPTAMGCSRKSTASAAMTCWGSPRTRRTVNVMTQARPFDRSSR